MIAEEELNGEDRAKYGAAIIKYQSKRLTAVYGKGFTKTNLYSFVQFYHLFPNIFHSLSGKFTPLLFWTHDDESYYALNGIFSAPPTLLSATLQLIGRHGNISTSFLMRH